MKKRIEHFHAPPWSVVVLIAVWAVLFFAPTASAVSGGDASVDWIGLSVYLGEQFEVCKTEIDISAYNIPYNKENEARISSVIYHEMPEYFHLDKKYTLSFITGKNIYIKLNVTYRCTAEEYAEQRKACEEVVEQLTRDLRNNTKLTDVQKALLLHDRLAVHCAYTTGDLDAPNAHSMYGALVLRDAVCEGYAEAYKYLLEQVGIESDYCSSDDLNHAWNIVYLDGKSYHVDVTKDDPVPDQIGRVTHKRFLISTSALAALDNDQDIDYDTSPADTTYDNYFWQSSETAFQLVDGKIYYIDNGSETLKIKTYDGYELLSTNQKWYISNTNSYYPGLNFSRLSSDGTRLYYSLPKGIYEFDPSTKMTELVCEPDESKLECYSIWGFRYEDGFFVYNLDEDWYSAPAAIEVRVPYPSYTLTGRITAYNPQTAITLTLLQDGSAVQTVELATDSSGSGVTTQSFVLSGIKAGTYELLINKVGHLTCRITGLDLTRDIDLTQSENTSLANITLRCGDVNGDAQIDIQDVALLRVAAEACDLDGDGVCGKVDVSIIRATENYYMCADDCVITYP